MADGNGVGEDLPVDGINGDVLVPASATGLGNLNAEELRTRYVRLLADMTNMRKQNARELEKLRRLDQRKMVEDWLVVVDSVHRALESAPERHGPWYDGLENIERQMAEVLHRQGLTPMESTGRPFDPTCHEAICTICDPTQPDGTVAITQQQGYLDEAGNVVRPARVVVVRH